MITAQDVVLTNLRPLTISDVRILGPLYELASKVWQGRGSLPALRTALEAYRGNPRVAELQELLASLDREARKQMLQGAPNGAEPHK